MTNTTEKASAGTLASNGLDCIISSSPNSIIAQQETESIANVSTTAGNGTLEQRNNTRLVLSALLDDKTPTLQGPETYGPWYPELFNLYSFHKDGGDITDYLPALSDRWQSLISEATGASIFDRFQQVSGPSWIESSTPLNFPTVAGMLNEDIEPPAWVVEDMIPAGQLVFLVSDGGIGKSWLLVALAETLSGGGHSFMGHYCQPCNVLYVDMELSAGHFINRVKMIDNGLIQQKAITGRDTTHDTYYLETPNITLDGAREFLDRLPAIQGDTLEPTAFDFIHQAIKSTGARVVILDPLANMLGGSDENSAGDMAAICKALYAIARDTGAAIVIAHHTNKSRIEERGSTAIRNSAAAMFTLIRDDRGPNLRKFETTKARLSSELRTCYLDFMWRDGIFTIEQLSGGDLEEMAKQQHEDKQQAAINAVVDAVNSAPAYSLNKGQLTNNLVNDGIPRRKAAEAITAALDAGLITSKAKGKAVLYASKS